MAATQASTGVGLVPSSFYDRFTAGTVRFLRRALGRAAERLNQPAGRLRGHLQNFSTRRRSAVRERRTSRRGARRGRRLPG